MSSLDKVDIQVREPENMEMVRSVLVEITALLEGLLEKGERGELDLQNLPLLPADKRILGEILGTGEVSISLDVMGESRIIETDYSGVWRVTHRDNEGRVVSDTIEITPIPTIVVADHGEIRASHERLGSIGKDGR